MNLCTISPSGLDHHFYAVILYNFANDSHSQTVALSFHCIMPPIKRLCNMKKIFITDPNSLIFDLNDKAVAAISQCYLDRLTV